MADWGDDSGAAVDTGRSNKFSERRPSEGRRGGGNVGGDRGGFDSKRKFSSDTRSAGGSAPASGGESSNEHRVMLSNLPWKAGDSEIRDFLEGCGTIKAVNMFYNSQGKTAGVCEVVFEEADAVEQAMGKDGSDLTGRNCRVSKLQGSGGSGGGFAKRPRRDDNNNPGGKSNGGGGGWSAPADSGAGGDFGW
jgi:RNA recognition motif-containing protein